MSTVSETNQLDVGGWSPDTLHAWVRSMLDQIDRRNEQRFIEQETALDKAFAAANEVVLANFTERDKAVKILSETVANNVDQAEKALREHVKNQIEQIRSALASAEALEITRVEGVKSQIASVHREIDIETKANKEAVDKADKANEKRFESVNEFRAQMADQSALFISRREVEAMVTANAEKVTSLTDRINRSEGRGTGKEQLWGYAIGALGIIIALWTVISGNSARIDRNSLRDDMRANVPTVAVPMQSPAPIR